MTIRIVRGSDDILIQCPVTNEFIEAMKNYLDGLKDELNQDNESDAEKGLRALFDEG
jgi:hypothetical protein